MFSSINENKVKFNNYNIELYYNKKKIKVKLWLKQKNIKNKEKIKN